MGKKKFIEKKASATYRLFFRDSSDPNQQNPHGETSDRVFVRVDRNPLPSHGALLDADDDGRGDRELNLPDDSVFADADEDDDGVEDDGHIDAGIGISGGVLPSETRPPTKKGELLEDVRREILELGFPDDGYNYLIHLREIKQSGGGAAFYHNTKARLDRLPSDVKAYDASKLPMQSGSMNPSIHTVSSKTYSVKVQKVMDPDIAALLDESDLSRFNSDVEELEEDFVLMANQREEGEEEVPDQKKAVSTSSCVHVAAIQQKSMDNSNHSGPSVVEKPRVRRLIDEQFDMLTLREYGSDSEDCTDYDAPAEGESDLLAPKLNRALKDHVMDDMDSLEKYEVPRVSADHGSASDEELILDNCADLKKKCAEYAEMYSLESPDNTESLPFEESSSSDESGKWDCETIVSTYSNLDNHPGRIRALSVSRKVCGNGSRNLDSTRPVISLHGKNMLPVEFLPFQRGKAAVGKAKLGADAVANEEKGRNRHTETKEEKKERKAAVKEERREARRAKKECKGMYKGEAKRAQQAAALAGPNTFLLCKFSSSGASEPFASCSSG